MRRMMLIAVLLLLNAALACGVRYQARNWPQSPEPRTVVLRGTVERPDAPPPTDVVPSPVTAPENRAPEFHWDQVVAAGAPEFIRNLHEIGCPPKTIRDIVLSDLADRHTQERHAVLRPFLARIWDLVALGQEGMKEVEEALDVFKSRPRQEMEKARKLIEALERGQENRPSRLSPIHAGYLPEEKRKLAREIEERHNVASRELDQRAKELSPEAMKEQRKSLAAQRDNELRGALTADEFAEYQLRSSPQSGWARSLFGFTPSEQEMREIARLRTQVDAQYANLDRRDPAYKERSAERDRAYQALDAQIKGLMGQERFASFERARNGHFQQIYRITKRYDLPAQVSVDVFEMKRLAESRAAAIQNRGDLPLEDRQALLGAIQAETEAATRGTLGRAWQAYQDNGGQWINELGRIKDQGKR